MRSTFELDLGSKISSTYVKMKTLWKQNKDVLLLKILPCHTFIVLPIELFKVKKTIFCEKQDLTL